MAQEKHMSIEIGWKVTTEITGWLQQAISAARNRCQQRFAHIIGNAGVIVAGLRSIDREIYRLFLPLVYFNASGWPEDKRQEWADRLLALANEDVILPRMRAADSALAIQASQETDPEISGLIRQLRYVDRTRNPLIEGRESVGNLLEAQIFYMDTRIANFMPEIAAGLLGQDPEALADIRTMAELMVGHGPHASFPGGLRKLADEAEGTFGLLMGYQQHVFPSLPAPTWVWAP